MIKDQREAAGLFAIILRAPTVYLSKFVEKAKFSIII